MIENNPLEEQQDDEAAALLNEGGTKEEDNEPVGDDELPAFKRSLYHYRWRWYALTLICLLKVGGNFCFDNPSELQEHFEKKFNLSEMSYSLMYVLYAIPNIIMPLGNAYILKYMSLKKSLVVMSSIIIFGQLIQALGAYITQYWVVLVGRMLFGLGFGYLQMTQILYVFKWFLDAEISMAMGISQISFLFDFLGGTIVPKITKEYSLAVAFSIGAAFCVFSLIVAQLLSYMDDYTDDRDQKLIFDFNSGYGRRYEQQEWQKIDEKYVVQDIEEDIEGFEKIFWMFVIDNMLTISMILTTTAIGTDLMVKTYGYQQKDAAFYVTLPYLVASLTFVPLGFIADRFGYRQYIIIFGGICMITSFIIFIGSKDCQQCQSSTAPWIILGVPQAIFYVLQWGCLPFIVKSQQLKIALGIFISTFNLASGSLPFLMSFIHDFSSRHNGYGIILYTFLAMSIGSLCLKIAILRWDQDVRNGVLQQDKPLEAHLEDQDRAFI